MEFEQIPKRKERAQFECALHEENKNLNFDPDFLPYDDNRVKIIPTRDNRLGYVNASHITVSLVNISICDLNHSIIIIAIVENIKESFKRL